MSDFKNKTRRGIKLLCFFHGYSELESVEMIDRIDKSTHRSVILSWIIRATYMPVITVKQKTMQAVNVAYYFPIHYDPIYQEEVQTSRHPTVRLNQYLRRWIVLGAYFVAKEFIIQFLGIRTIWEPTAYTNDRDRKLGRHSFVKSSWSRCLRNKRSNGASTAILHRRNFEIRWNQSRRRQGPSYFCTSHASASHLNLIGRVQHCTCYTIISPFSKWPLKHRDFCIYAVGTFGTPALLVYIFIMLRQVLKIF